MNDIITKRTEDIKSKCRNGIHLTKLKELIENDQITEDDFESELTTLEKEIDSFNENYEKINSEINELDKLGFKYKDDLIDTFNNIVNENYNNIYSVMGGREYINKTVVQKLLFDVDKNFESLYDFNMKWDVTPLFPDDNTFKVTYRVGKEEGISRGFTWFYNFSGILYERKFDFLND